jgi:outer membrane protein assembly factor BamB
MGAMNLPNRYTSPGACVALIGLIFTALPPGARALNPVVTKLHGRATAQQPFNQFGTAVAATESWLLAGERLNDNRGNDAGAAHLYDARTGRFLRTLTAPDAAVDDFFGASVALSGNLALVGAPGANGAAANSGAAYVFNVLTGAFVVKLTAPDGVANDGFADRVALSGNLALVGAAKDDDLGLSSGSAYVFQARTGALVRKLTAPDGVADDFFGISVALSGVRALVGASGSGANRGAAYVLDAMTGDLVVKLTAPDAEANDLFGDSVALGGSLALVGATGDDTNRGSAYVMDARTGAQVHKLTAPDRTVEDFFGRSVALSGNRAVAGAHGNNSNPNGAYVYDTQTGALVIKLTAADGDAGDQFGFSVALSGNRALVGVPFDDDLSNGSGAAYLYREVVAPFPLASVTQARNFAPGLVDTTFRAFGEAAINGDGEVAFPATLAGPGAGRGAAAKGLWSDEPGTLRLIARGGTDLGGGLQAGAMGRPVFNRGDDIIYTGTLAGVGVSRANDLAILLSADGGLPAVVLREGGTDAALAGGQWGSFPEVVVSHTGASGDLGAAFSRKLGIGGVDRASDSGVLVADVDGTLAAVFLEKDGLVSQPGITWGQFAPRVAKSGALLYWSAALSGAGVTAATNQGLFQAQAGNAEQILARRGDPATEGGGALYGTILGEGSSTLDLMCYRATLSGPGVTRANNEGLWQVGALVARKGDQPDPANEPGVVFSRFLRFWTFGAGRLIFQTTLAGPGVNRNNDGAIYLWQNGLLQRLLREGDTAQTEDGAVISTINRVDVEPTNGQYAVLASLTGNRAANLALYTGSAQHGDNGTRKLARLPGLALRKGTAFNNASGETTRLLSLLIGNPTDAAGAGGKGGPQSILEDGNLVMTVLLSNGAVELMKGKP